MNRTNYDTFPPNELPDDPPLQDLIPISGMEHGCPLENAAKLEYWMVRYENHRPTWSDMCKEEREATESLLQAIQDHIYYSIHQEGEDEAQMERVERAKNSYRYLGGNK